jgi:hypothetical protein
MVLALGATGLKYFLGLNPLWGVLLLALFTGLYTVVGGMSSVAWTDTFQCVLLLAGGLAVFGIGLAHVPGGWTGLMNRMPEPHLIRGLQDNCIPWPGLIVLALSTNVWYCCTNQFYVQSCLGAKDQWHGQMGVLLTAFLGPVLTLCCAFPGYIARDLLNLGLLPPLPTGEGGTPDANAALPHLVACFLGPVLGGYRHAADCHAAQPGGHEISVHLHLFPERLLHPGHPYHAGVYSRDPLETHHRRCGGGHVPGYPAVHRGAVCSRRQFLAHAARVSTGWLLVRGGGSSLRGHLHPLPVAQRGPAW